eukprot:COSAG02_NODE_430_length_22462_cov_52.755042_19_plen_1433_part_00
MFVLASKFPALVALIDTVIKCLRASMALVLITSLIVYLYAILGMNFFGLLPADAVLERFDFTKDEITEMRRNATIFARVCPDCSVYSDYTNFSDFLQSLRLLMQCIFGQGISGFVVDMEYLGADFWMTFAFMASFFMLSVWVCINLLIVTVVSNFDAVMTDTHDGHGALTPLDFDGFAHSWAALTIGTHSSTETERRTAALLEHLSEKLQEECEAHNSPFEEPHDVNFENGDPDLVGTLTVHIQRVDGLNSAAKDVRPYARMISFGSNSSCDLKMSTPVIKPNDDGNSAVWDSSDHADSNEYDRRAMNLLVTGFHTHLDFEVIDGFQFCDDLVGGCTISMEEIRAGCQTGNGRSTRTLTLMRDTMFKTRNAKPGVSWKRWERYASFVDEEEALDEEVADTDVENPVETVIEDDDDEVVPLTAKQKKELKKAEKKKQKVERAAAKAERKYLKKKAKAEKKEAKRRAKERKKLLKQGLLVEEDEEEDVLEPEPHRFHRAGWEETGVTVTVVFDYVPKLCLEKTHTFLDDYTVRYAHKESNAGVEGWMEVSESLGPFKSRFCYIQRHPYPCFKFVRDASNVSTLETLGLRNSLKLCTVAGSQILSLFSGHDKNSATTARKNISFQLVSYEDAGTGRQEEAQIGLMAGTVVGASNLKTQQEAEGVLMVEEVKFGQVGKLDGGAVVAAYAPGGAAAQEEDNDANESDGEAQDEDRFDEEDEGIIELQSPVRYMAVRRTTLRNGSSLESEQRGHVKRGEIILATHSKMLGNLKRIRCQHGWCSTTTVSGRSVLLISENSEHRYYKANKSTPIGADIPMSAKQVGSVKKGDVVEALEFAKDSGSGGVNRIRVSEGWISELDTTLSGTIDPYCVIQAVPVGGWPSASSSSSRLQRTAGPRDPDDDLEQSRQRAAQSLRTHVIEDSTDPEWNHDFEFIVYPSSWKLVVSVFDANSTSTTPIGMGEVEYSKDDNHSIPGKAVFGSGVGKIIELSSREGTVVKVQLVSECGKGKVKSAGSVLIEMTYTDLIPTEELVAARDRAGGDFHKAMMVEEKAEKVYRFRCMNSELRRSWLTALRWVATGCDAYKCRSAVPDRLPSARMIEADAGRLESDISLVDLPFCRSSLLIQSLYNRRVMGSHKPTLRWLTYVVFNLETFGWSQGSVQLGRKKRKQLGFDGATLSDLRGLNFHLTLERLCLLHYGKAKCLSYDEQMQEYRAEVYHCSMHLVCSAVGWWVARRRIGKTWGGYQWPWDARFRNYPNVYKAAIEGACASRVRSLVLLRKCIETRGRPELLGVDLPSRVRLAPKANERGTCGCGGGDSGMILEEAADDDSSSIERADVEAAFKRLDTDGSGLLDHKEVKEALMNMTGSAEEEEVDRMVAAMDADQNGEIDINEFVDAMMRILQSADSETKNSDDEDSDLDEFQIPLAKLQVALLSEVNE